jgi:hypothetical protein
MWRCYSYTTRSWFQTVWMRHFFDQKFHIYIYIYESPLWLILSRFDSDKSWQSWNKLNFKKWLIIWKKFSQEFTIWFYEISCNNSYEIYEYIGIIKSKYYHRIYKLGKKRLIINDTNELYYSYILISYQSIEQKYYINRMIGKVRRLL